MGTEAKVKESPIPFSAPMVRATLDGRKTQARRVAKPQSQFDGRDGILRRFPRQFGSPYGEPGDRLWVRETWGLDWYDNGNSRAWKNPVYRADPGAQPMDQGSPTPWRSPIHMPRWASRITLEITDVRVERLQEITQGAARAEGITDGGCLNCGESEPCGCADAAPDARDAFAYFWHTMHPEKSVHGWHTNPWVWVISFRRVK